MNLPHPISLINRCLCMLVLLGHIVVGNETIPTIHSESGTTYFPFLRLGYEARSVAMGGANAGLANEIYGTMGNPAALGYLTDMQAMMSYKPVILDVRGGSLAFGMPYKKYGVLAANVVYLSHGEISPVDENNEPILGTLNPFSVAANISWSKLFFNSLSLGATFKGIYELLSEGLVSSNDIHRVSADGLAFDLGAQYKTRNSRVVYGILVRNVGVVRSDYEGDQFKKGLPISYIAGISCLLPSLTAAFDLEKTVDNFLQYKLGLEFNIYKDNIFLRAGSNIGHSDIEQFFKNIRNTDEEKSDYYKSNWSMFSVGGGIKSKIDDLKVYVDTAFNFRVNRLPFGFALSMILVF